MIKIQELNISDVESLVLSFAKVNWHKPKEFFEQYLQEQHEDKRLIWVAYLDDQIASYITLVWQSKYLPFYKNQIPEIKDLNVLPSFRNLGIGLKLLKTAKNGYIPDGQGIAYNDQTLNFGAETILDDNLVLFFTKKIK